MPERSVKLRKKCPVRIDPPGAFAPTKEIDTFLQQDLDDLREIRQSHGRHVAFQMAEVAVSRQMFADILTLISRLRAPARPRVISNGRKLGP